MNKADTSTNSWQAKNTRNTWRLAGWAAAWVVATAVMAFGPKFLWDYDVPLSIFATLLNLAIGAGMIMATIRHLQGQDELQQKVFMQSTAITLGIVLVWGSCYELLHDIKLITFEPEISHLLMLAAIAFLVSLFSGLRKYQ